VKRALRHSVTLSDAARVEYVLSVANPENI